MRFHTKLTSRTRRIGVKVQEAVFDALRKTAESQGKPLGEWCRDTLMKAVLPPPPRPSELAMVAEISPTQDILIDMLLAMGRDRVSTQRAQEIVDRAQKDKYREAIQLLGFAYSRAQKLNLEVFTCREPQAKAKEHAG